MKTFISELSSSYSRRSNPPLHFSSYYFLDKEAIKKRDNYLYSSSFDVEKEYQQINNNTKKQSTLIDITSENLKSEYLKNFSIINNGLYSILILSIIYLIDSIINQKFLESSVINIIILIITCISISTIIMLLISIKSKVLIDAYRYISFYYFSIFEAIILLTLMTLKSINFIKIFGELNLFENCRNKYRCPGYFIYLLLLSFSIVIFVGIFASFKFTIYLFSEAYNILTKRKKTIIQRQIEINEKNEKIGKIEFVDENNNNSISKLNINDYLKTE